MSFIHSFQFKLYLFDFLLLFSSSTAFFVNFRHLNPWFPCICILIFCILPVFNEEIVCQVVDMQACALPVLSADFPCAKELVQHSENGFLFADAGKLHDLLVLLFTDHPRNEMLHQVRRIAKRNQQNQTGWFESWSSNVEPYLKSDRTWSLPSSGVEIIIYAEFDNLLMIDKDRNVFFDYSA